MFTGLIEAVGRVAGVRPAPSGSVVRVRTDLAGELRPGDSLAVNGVCLTVTVVDGDVVQADVGPETMRVTALGVLREGQPVNLERSMRADSRFGGHFVQGHVDATGVLEGLRVDGDAHWLTIGFPPSGASLIVPKGSIALDGISLTVAALHARQFDVMIVPFTWEHTHLPSLGVGDPVNLEFDVVGKYVGRAVELALPQALAGQQKASGEDRRAVDTRRGRQT